ncbi:6,7-dimethyl-8-ribityllumazine synthase [Cryptococcus neoformans var. grubii Br795]|uniref:6,7-dimethyl-8-ribityllumazine synthase n=1 Tax=Cryptococcus neoformans Tu259-1 TaxID=1230072 RepID=A0A854QE99_CRYNE|nr:6,7-dimethyl-8-ribityllumazine synthase [Cryptococcus neoformans var. grubii Bt1]OWZ53201.1 6,7-dimethyl-8-ribityllumazine synthase [Cryptococcus neoformans var. grubii 125.91]OXG18230.1 6,7-dimethyl-8-ribityllumazine synthase [Cryptococcus neoformans var. grubii Tu259-1]OXG22896.1 6,7-dimethyl-8-ribityllumazine synthase [Cryptococcus neoformans var. grubii Ze90-1]OXG30505.1 6,7-dimethyl-8-ribityllumazine synthase [Cryptococcus neoformans var. grubii Bt15]OXG39847.1 6,7-dimethyl-8-ribityllu
MCALKIPRGSIYLSSLSHISPIAMLDNTVKGLPPAPTTYDGSGLRIAIVHARWNDTIINALLAGALAKLRQQGVKDENIVVKTVAGSYELPLACKKIIEAGKTQSANAAPSMLASTTNLLSLIDNSSSAQQPAAQPQPQATQPQAAGASTAPFDAVIAIGCLIKGSTMHFEYICEAVSQGLMNVQLQTGTPVVFGVLTVLNDEQALVRAGVGSGEDKGHNHGEDWGLAAVELASQYKEWEKGVL